MLTTYLVHVIDNLKSIVPIENYSCKFKLYYSVKLISKI